MNAAEGQGLQVSTAGGGCATQLFIIADLSSAELEFFIEQQVARAFALLDCQRGQRVMFFVELQHTLEIDRADYVHVVKNEWPGLVLEKPSSFLQAAAGIEQNILTRDLNAHAEILIGLQVVNDLICKVMDVDDDF